jgi:hypothetical protein
MTIHEGSFEAKDDEGNVYTIHMFRSEVQADTLEGPEKTPPALGQLRTQDGRAVKWLEKGRYEIVDDPKVAISSDDPEAP